MPRYECDQCGACCTGRLIVQAEDLDVMREPRLIEADPYWAGIQDAWNTLAAAVICFQIAGKPRGYFLKHRGAVRAFSGTATRVVERHLRLPIGPPR